LSRDDREWYGTFEGSIYFFQQVVGFAVALLPIWGAPVSTATIIFPETAALGSETS
jgi:hypothetical protein